ncbi:MAG: hypothetical protein C0597_13625 [Marinilabiliales bacterium]|nr:MAG: hypothetical protein C0597_13625 [Marinilabiliales bacterium]
MEQRTQKEDSFKHELTRIFFIAVGVFLFILFFQPFPLDSLNYDNRLLYVTGFGGIIFLFTFLILVLIPFLFPKWFKLSIWERRTPLLLIITLLIVIMAANAFYIRYVGNTDLSLYILFKTFLVSLLPIIILNILFKNKSLESIIEILQDHIRLYQARISELECNGMEEEISIYSDTKSDKITLKFKNIVSVQSADNYIEVHYLEKEVVEKKLIRNTLKNIEIQLVKRPELMRCHRTSIVNMLHVEKLLRTYNGYSLKMNYLEHDIPVSRQYLVLIRDAISNTE